MKKFKSVVNLTPHNITIIVGDQKWDIEPSGTIVRAVEFDSQPFTVVVEELGMEVDACYRSFGVPQENMHVIGQLNGKTVCFYGDPENLYIVSLPLLQVLSINGIVVENFAAPDTGKGAVRDEQNRIVGVRSLVFMNGETKNKRE